MSIRLLSDDNLGCDEITNSQTVPKPRWPSGTLEMPLGPSGCLREALPGRKTLLGRTHQASGQPGICLWLRGHPSASTSYLGFKGLPGPFFLLSLISVCVFMQPLHSQALKKDLLQPKPAVVT